MKNPNIFFPKLLTLVILTSLFLVPVFQTQAETLVIPTKWVTNALKAVKLADLLTVAGLTSIYGSGSATREAGLLALKKIAKESGLTLDEVMEVADKVAGNYKVGSVQEFKDFISKLDKDSFDNFIKEVKRGVEEVAQWSARTIIGATKQTYINKFSVPTKQIQEKFKHAKELFPDEMKNVNWSPLAGEKFKKALIDFTKKTDTDVLDGTFRNTQPAIHFYNRTTNQIVAMDKKTGEFISGWILMERQIPAFLRNFNLQ